ncbi:VOC family protein [Paenibacillus lignilyticus]|uniref:Glyoxalase/bleomycin resistance/dioxygenase family protein n=1 Tax=Paenibacillus lignilyticus TaxID=1172615 RepID=A0ABS5CM46_9BACL|nr:glyoxalase/bleomycin resistance/dioxygenase family protein [Paenibacillus lignilyticus]MBP3966945.1 glyoxalase/bleomycin resistance/dioxygenase family protein [Paenibacillus lignilyticus]
MVTHFSRLQLHTFSIPGVKQFYHEQLAFPISHESDTEIHFQPLPSITLCFTEGLEPNAPAHIAFEVAASGFDAAVGWLRNQNVTLLKWPDGRIVDEFDSRGRNVYFRDGDGNLLEIICHSYVQEGILPPIGNMSLLYLREVGMPVEADAVIPFREQLVRLMDFGLDKVFDNFTFAIGGTAHAILVSKARKWIPIAMAALPPAISISFGVSSIDFLEGVKTRLAAEGIPFESDAPECVSFRLYSYPICLEFADFGADVPARLQLPLARLKT